MSGRVLRWLMSLAVAPSGANGGVEPRLTIVRHHRVYPDRAEPLYRLGVSESTLRAQLEMLASLHLAPVSVVEGLARIERREPGHVIAMSFDDGYADNLRIALPLLGTAGASATFYLTAGLIESRRAPWWDVLAYALEHARVPHLRFGGLDLPLESFSDRRRALAAMLPQLRVAPAEQRARLEALRLALDTEGEAPCELASWEEARGFTRHGMEVGAHTLAHPFLSRLAPGDQALEIAGSVEEIERRLGVRPTGLAYPGGDYDAASIEAARRAGLAYAVTTRAGDNLAETPRYELRRRGLSEGACLGLGGRFSRRLALAELRGTFDRLRARHTEVAT